MPCSDSWKQANGDMGWKRTDCVANRGVEWTLGGGRDGGIEPGEVRRGHVDGGRRIAVGGVPDAVMLGGPDRRGEVEV